MTEIVAPQPGRRLDAYGARTVLSVLERAEERVAGRIGGPPSPHWFRQVGDCLIREDGLWASVLRALPWTRVPDPLPVRGLPRRSRVHAAIQLIATRRLRSTSRADVIFVRSHLRAFYRTPGVTLWIGLRTSSQQDLSLAASARQRFGSGPAIRTPRVIQEDVQARPPYILEELIQGRPFDRPSDWELAGNTLLPFLFEYYGRTGVEHRRSADVYDLPRIQEDVTKLLVDFADQGSGLELDRFLSGAFRVLQDCDRTVPVCSGHGDLARSNLLVTREGTLVVLDWERCRSLPIASDLIQLVFQHPPLQGFVERALFESIRQPGDLAPREQLVLAALNKLSGFAREDVLGATPSLARSLRPKKVERIRARLRFAATTLSA